MYFLCSLFLCITHFRALYFFIAWFSALLTVSRIHNYFFFINRENFIFIILNQFFSTHTSFFVTLCYMLFLSLFFFYKNFFLIVFAPAALFSTFFNLSATAASTNSLINGFVLIHPVLLLLFYFFFLICIFSGDVKTIKEFFLNTSIITFKRYIFISGISAGLLGSLWAQQELNWGGWWSWDFIEIGFLFIFLYAVINLHVRTNSFLIVKKSFFLCFFVFFFLGVRLNFFSSIHSFVSASQTKFFLNFLVLLLLLINKSVYKITNFTFFNKFFLTVSYLIIFFFINEFFINVLNLKYSVNALFIYLIIYLLMLGYLYLFFNFFHFYINPLLSKITIVFFFRAK